MVKSISSAIYQKALAGKYDKIETRAIKKVVRAAATTLSAIETVTALAASQKSSPLQGRAVRAMNASASTCYQGLGKHLGATSLIESRFDPKDSISWEAKRGTVTFTSDKGAWIKLRGTGDSKLLTLTAKNPADRQRTAQLLKQMGFTKGKGNTFTSNRKGAPQITLKAPPPATGIRSLFSRRELTVTPKEGKIQFTGVKESFTCRGEMTLTKQVLLKPPRSQEDTVEKLLVSAGYEKTDAGGFSKKGVPDVFIGFIPDDSDED